MTADGKRFRKFFPSITAAEKYAAKLRAEHNSGKRAGMIPASLALMAAEAERILAGSGISIVEAARMAAARIGTEADRETFGERYKRAMLAKELVWRPAYSETMTRLLNWIPASFLDLPCGVIDRAAIERALTASGPKARSTLDMRSSRINAILGYHERHSKSQTIHVLSDVQLKALLAACDGPQETMAVALLLYAGIRPDADNGEIRRLDWDAVGNTEIFVSKEVSKVGERLIPVTPALARLIEGHPESGTVIPANWKRVWTRLRKAAGITANDVCRHTFASHFLAWKGEDATKNAMGHTAGSSTLFRHYRRAVTEAAGAEYFA
jgi:hypothetical protein